jgi:hypothetical protein
MRFAPAVAFAFCLVPGAVAAQGDVEKMTAEARALAAQLQAKLAPELKKEIAAHGPAGAIGVCKRIGTEVARGMSEQHGARVSRVSLKPRNPLLGPADPWEQQALLDFDRRAAAGEKPETLERGEIVREPAGFYFRYAKALPVISLCLNCHGAPEALAPAVKERLAAEYPRDHATGYSLGQIRGAVTVKRPL